MKQDPSKIRNIAIIAHVDHGKTTLVDGLLKQSETFRANQAEMSQELIMDSGDQERERGITITAKVTAVQRGEYRINIIDTPGHADFSGEVERTINMADGCLLVVDAQEGPMPQTKFVLGKALASGLKPIVIINKIDKAGSRITEVENELADLFLELVVHEDQLHYPIYYAVGRSGKAWKDVPANFEADGNLDVIFDAIINDIPAPQVTLDAPFQMLVNALAWDNFKGKYAIGRISAGRVKAGDQVTLCKKNGQFTQRSEEHTSELQSHSDLVCRLLLEKKKNFIRCCSISASTPATPCLPSASSRCRRKTCDWTSISPAWPPMLLPDLMVCLNMRTRDMD